MHVLKNGYDSKADYVSSFKKKQIFHGLFAEKKSEIVKLSEKIKYRGLSYHFKSILYLVYLKILVFLIAHLLF